MKDKRIDFILSAAATVTAAAVIYLGFKFIFPLLLPFVIAFAAAALLQRPIASLRRRAGRLPKNAAAVLVTTFSLLMAFGLLITLGAALWSQLSDFLSELPQAVGSVFSSFSSGGAVRMRETLERLPEWLSVPMLAVFDAMIRDLPGSLLDLTRSFSGLLADSLGTIGSFALKLPSAALTLFITITALFFISVDYAGAKELLLRLLPKSAAEWLRQIKRCSLSAVASLIKAYALLMLITFVELVIGFFLIDLCGLTIQHIVPLALLTALVDILPVLGVGAVLVPWGLLELCGSNSALGAALLVLYALIAIIRNFLEPRIVGKRFGLHPAAALLSIYIGGKAFGIAGVFLLPLAVIVAKEVWDSEHKRSGTEHRNA